MEKVNENLIRNLTWSNLSEITLTDKWLYDSNFRIVNLIDCPSVSDFKNVLCDNDCVKNVLLKSEYLFCLIVHVKAIDDESILNDLSTIIKDIFLESGKHFLIEFYVDSLAYVKYTFSQRKVTSFIKSDSEQKVEIRSESVYTLLEFGLEAAKYEEYIRDAAEKCDCLLIRILKSFNLPLKLSSEKALLQKLVTKNHEALKA